MSISGKTLERLSLYRKLLAMQSLGKEDSVYSRQLAEWASGTPAQVRRDLMELGVAGHQKRGYQVGQLLTRINRFFDAPNGTSIALVGMGDLGRAILKYVRGDREGFRVIGIFDNDPSKIGRIIHGYRCESVDGLKPAVLARCADMAIITTPAEAAQSVCDSLAATGVRGFLNFALTPLQVPEGVFVERVDISTALEKVACLVHGESSHWAASPHEDEFGHRQGQAEGEH